MQATDTITPNAQIEHSFQAMLEQVPDRHALASIAAALSVLRQRHPRSSVIAHHVAVIADHLEDLETVLEALPEANVGPENTEHKPAPAGVAS